MGVALVVSQSHLARDPRVRRTVRTLLEEGWDVDGLFLDAPSSGEHLRTWRFPLDHKRSHVLRYLVEYSLFFIWTLCWVLWRLLVHRPALVYVNSPPDLLAFAATPARFFGVPIVLDVHDPMPELFSAKGRKSRLVHALLVTQERWSIRFADRVVTVHEPLRRLLQQRSPSVRIDVVMNVPETRKVKPLSRDPSSRLVVFAGTVAYRYGLDDVLRAIELVSDTIPDVRLRVIGDGDDLERLMAASRSEGLIDRVEFVGRVPYEQVRDAQIGAWVGVNVPKPDELGGLSFSNKIVEWMALRLPVVASRTTTLESFFPDGAIIYVQAGSAEAIADGLVRLHRMSEAEIEALLDRAQAALTAIAWPVQRAALLEVVSEATRNH